MFSMLSENELAAASKLRDITVRGREVEEVSLDVLQEEHLERHTPKGLERARRDSKSRQQGSSRLGVVRARKSAEAGAYNVVMPLVVGLAAQDARPLNRLVHSEASGKASDPEAHDQGSMVRGERPEDGGSLSIQSSARLRSKSKMHNAMPIAIILCRL